MATRVLRLSLPCVHERGRVQPDRRDAAGALGQTSDGGRGDGFSHHCGTCNCSSSQHPQIASRLSSAETHKQCMQHLNGTRRTFLFDTKSLVITQQKGTPMLSVRGDAAPGAVLDTIRSEGSSRMLAAALEVE